MPLTCAIFGCDEGERQALETALQATGKVVLNPIEPDVAVVALPRQETEGALAKLAALRAQMPQAHLIAVGAMDPPQLIVAAMRAGANEYLEAPVRADQLDEALTRCAKGAGPGTGLRPATRGKLIVVLGARGGCGCTTVAVNLALALQAQRRQADASVVLVDAAPLGHAALHLNLRPQYTLTDLARQGQRLDAALLASLLLRHGSGLQLLAGPSAPLPSDLQHDGAAWLELLTQHHPLTVMELSARLDALTAVALERADRILFVTQTDMVSLWSAAKVHEYLDPAARMRFELVLNRHAATPAVDLDAVESITKTTIAWKLPNAHAEVNAAIERGEPVALGRKTELARSFHGFATSVLGRAPERRSWRGWFRKPMAMEAGN